MQKKSRLYRRLCRRVVPSSVSAARVEILERRQLLAAHFPTSVIWTPATDISRRTPASGFAYTQYQIQRPQAEPDGLTPQGIASPANGAKTPSQIRTAYGLNNVVFGAVAGDGTGQIIAIVDAFDDPSFVSDTDANYGISDLTRFDTQFGLAAPPSFKKVNQTGGTSYPSYNSGWAGEIALDVEWAHAMAPKAGIVLVEASSNGNSNLDAAVKFAKTIAGVTAVTMSYGGGEFSGETGSDTSVYSQPTGGHPAVTFFASSGDTGGALIYASSSPNVVGVGGSHLLAGGTGTYVSETAWSGSGGGTSIYETKPSYQSLVTTPSSSKRTSPDVSMDADPSSGVAVLDSSAGGIGSANPWVNGVVGGTSLSSPMWAGLMAIVNQGRAIQGLGSLAGATQTLPRLYTVPSTDYHDVISGSAGSFTAGVGYDLITGRGTPVSTSLLPDLAGAVTITGTVFVDANDSGTSTPDAGEAGISGVTVYLDTNNNGTADAGEPTTTTNASGVYTFSDLIGHVTYTVREVTPAGDTATTATSLTASGAYATTVSRNFGNFPSTFTGSAFSLQLDPTGLIEQIYTNANSSGLPAFSIPVTAAGTLTFNGTSGNDTFAIDLSSGNPLLGVTASFNGASGTADTVIVRGSAGSDSVSFAAGSVSVGASSFSLSNIEAASFDGALGLDNLSVTGGPAVTLPDSQSFQSLTLGAGASVILAAGQQILTTRGLNLGANARLDLTDGALIYNYNYPAASPIDSIRSLIQSAYAGGTWSGPGITSSSAAAPNSYHSLAYAEAADLFALSGVATDTWLGQTVGSSTLLIQYARTGDSNFDGTLDGTDRARTLEGLSTGQTGWRHGDFNYDGVVNAADYQLLDAAINPPPAPASSVALRINPPTLPPLAPPSTSPTAVGLFHGAHTLLAGAFPASPFPLDVLSRQRILA